MSDRAWQELQRAVALVVVGFVIGLLLILPRCV